MSVINRWRSFGESLNLLVRLLADRDSKCVEFDDEGRPVPRSMGLLTAITFVLPLTHMATLLFQTISYLNGYSAVRNLLIFEIKYR